MEATETSEDAAYSATYKRPGVVGIDYDHYGEEMAPNARIWRAYVEQTDKIDKEVVDGWNKTLDIILLFATLFSAISTAFVLESSKDLKPDPAETSARTLSLISQTLLAMSNNSINTPIVADPDGTEFVAETSAVVVNALWFMSLSLSVAVTLIAILAKEWCDGFISGRIGSMLKQGRIRQQRWDGIERWKMREILYMLPLLMHAALCSAGPERDRLLEETSLYSRSFTFLTSHIPVDLYAEGLPEPGAVPRMPMHYWSIAEDSNRAPYYGVADGFGCVVRPFSILAYSLRSPIRHDVAAFELNNFPLDLGNTHWKGFNHSRKQHANQWELLGHINSEQLKLSPSAIRALVNGIAKSYLYKLPELGFHSPIALVNLLHTTKPLGIHEEELSMDQQERKTKLRLTIGMALAVIHFAKKDAPGLGDSDTTWDAHLLQAKGVHDTLAKSKLGSHDVELLLLFGLLGLLGKPETSGSSPRLTLILDEVESIGRALNGLGVREWLIEPSNAPLPLPDSAPSHPLELGEYWAIMASDWLDAAYPPSGSALEPQSRTFSTSCLNAILCTGLCSTFPKFIIPPLVNRFRLSRSPELKRRCVVALISALPPDSGGLARVVFKDQFMESDFADQLILFLDSEPGDGQMQLLGFHFIWIVANSITADGGDQAETALLSKLFKSPVSLSENRIHRNQHGMSLIDIWRERLEGICASDPRFVLDSRILREVRSVYDSNPGIRPYPAKPSDGERSWDTILEELEMDCRKRLAAQVDTEASRLVAKGPEKEQSDSVGGV